ncbi:autotransporter domain-containing protein [Variovorax sp. KK3]|uniref:autotransporter domain-containing protein n=1 Tax=Variovorax sp. KK3 TaxID=1855728 RepID=UPI003AAD14B8
MDPALQFTAPPIVTPKSAPLIAALPAQQREAGFAMVGNLHQRIGDENLRAGGASDTDRRRAWARLIRTDLDIRQGGGFGSLSDGHLNGVQVGTDLWASGDWRAGVYVGRLDGKSNVSALDLGIWGPVGSSDLRSQYLGGYATYANASGFYADFVLQGGHQRYTLTPILELPVKGKGRSFLASVEVGQSFALNPTWKIEPQLQLVHQRVRFDDVTVGGAQVQTDSNDGWLVRVGARIKGEFPSTLGGVQPYARVNFYHAGGGADTARYIGPLGVALISSGGGSRSSSELAAGVTLTLSPRVSVYGELGKIWSSGGETQIRSAVQGSLGLRVSW